MRGLVRIVGLMGAALLALAPAAHAQGCVLCYTSLAGAGPAAMRAFELAMLVLLVPALLLFAGVFLFIFLRARGASSAEEARAPKAARRPAFAPGIAAAAEGRL